jgi:acetylglutamate kinase
LRFTIKLGGSILEKDDLRRAILGEVAELAGQGHQIVLVHGGGKNLSRRLAQAGIESRFIDGLRVTDASTLAVAVMVLAGEVNKTLVSEMEMLGCRALGFCGADAAAVRCERLSDLAGAPQELGFVGRPVSLNCGFFELLFGAGLVPVVSSIALGPDHGLYNVNADQMASLCASGTGAQLLVYLTDVPGVLGENGAILESLGRKDIESLRARGILSGGMLPKTTSCLEALEKGIRSVYIVPGNSPGILKRVVYGKPREGTHIHGTNE